MMSELNSFTDRRTRKSDRRHSDIESINQTQASQPAFTFREQQVLLALSQGQTDNTIAMQLGLSHKTVQHHIRGLFRKLGTQNRTQAVVKAIKLGLIKL
jgi:DNA-binding NarL/FixJ family response regulator